MMTTVDALKGLYVLLGGNAEDVENISRIPDMINAYENLSSLTAVGDISKGSDGVLEISAQGEMTITAADEMMISTSQEGTININSDGDVRVGYNGDAEIYGQGNFLVDVENGDIAIRTEDSLEIQSTGDNDIDIRQTGTSGINIATNDGSIEIAASGDIRLQTSNDGEIDITADNQVLITSGASIILNAPDGEDICLRSPGEGGIRVQIGSGSEMTLENYIKQVAGIS